MSPFLHIMGLNETSDNALFLVETENLRIIPKVTYSPAVKGSLNSLDFFVYISPYPNSRSCVHPTMQPSEC